MCVSRERGTLLPCSRKSQSESSSNPQPMAAVANTILGLIPNLRAFGGILVVSPGALVVGWVAWLCGVQLGYGWPASALARRPISMLGCQTLLAPSFHRGPGVTVSTLFQGPCGNSHDPWVMYHSKKQRGTWAPMGLSLRVWGILYCRHTLGLVTMCVRQKLRCAWASTGPQGLSCPLW